MHILIGPILPGQENLAAETILLKTFGTGILILGHLRIGPNCGLVLRKFCSIIESGSVYHIYDITDIHCFEKGTMSLSCRNDKGVVRLI